MAPSNRRDRLRGDLHRLRTLAALSGRELAARLGTTQATISRIERGGTTPSMRIVRAWLDATAAAERDRVRILELAEGVHAETRGWAELLGDVGHAQHEPLLREQAAAEVCNFQPTVVPGLLQTPEYARAVLSIGRTRDVAAALAARIDRQQVLYQEGHHFRFLIAEHVLYRPVGGRHVLAAQRDRLVSLLRLPAVEIGIVPIASEIAAVWHNFVLWNVTNEPPYVTAELVHGSQEIHDTDAVELYRALWKQLWASAITGDKVAALIHDLG